MLPDKEHHQTMWSNNCYHDSVYCIDHDYVIYFSIHKRSHKREVLLDIAFWVHAINSDFIVHALWISPVSWYWNKCWVFKFFLFKAKFSSMFSNLLLNICKNCRSDGTMFIWWFGVKPEEIHFACRSKLFYLKLVQALCSIQFEIHLLW